MWLGEYDIITHPYEIWMKICNPRDTSYHLAVYCHRHTVSFPSLVDNTLLDSI